MKYDGSIRPFALFLLATAAILISNAAGPVARPPLTKIANFVVKTNNMEEARKFYSGVLGYDEVFRHKRAISGGRRAPSSR